MRRVIYGLFAWLVSALAAGAADTSALPEALAACLDLSSVRLRMGDDAHWADPAWPDDDWEQVSAGDLPARTGVYWIRRRVSGAALQPGTPAGLGSPGWAASRPDSALNSIYVSAVFSFELYWDGRLLERSGTVGSSRQTEIPGPLSHLIPIPQELLGPGEHVLALRLSNYHYNFPGRNRFAMSLSLDNFARRQAYEARQPLLPMVAGGAGLLVAGISFVLAFFIDRRRLLLLCGLLSLAIVAFCVLVAWRWLYNAPYDWLWPRYLMTNVVLTLIAGLVPLVLLEQFEIGRRRWWLAALVPLLVGAWMTSTWQYVIALWLFRVMLIFSLAVAVVAVWRRRAGAWVVLVAALAGLASVNLGGTDLRHLLAPPFFLTFGVLMLSVFGALGMQLRDQRRRAQETRLRAARLEIELLKKSLQPHFLLNTLTALSEVVERDPPGAVALIEDLATEFRSLARMSTEQQIPLAQELELCRAHLRVISTRTGIDWSLQADGIDLTASLPPAIFLTLIENGLVHQRPAGRSGTFQLRAEQLSGLARYIFLSPGEPRAGAARSAGGSGLRYVMARLEESFPQRWRFDQHPVPEGWETVIEIRGGA